MDRSTSNRVVLALLVICSALLVAPVLGGSPGVIVSWGNDDYGVVSGTPAGTGYTAGAAGSQHSVALRANGSIVSWGINDGSSLDYGQVSGTPAGAGYTAVAAGYLHSLALTSDGSIVSWGCDNYGQVSQAPAGTGYTAVAAGGYHSLALKADGSIVSWGWNYFGQVSQTPAGTGYTAVAAGPYHSLALRYPRPLRAVPPSTEMPLDLDDDGLCEDVNGNGRADFADVVLFFDQMTWIAENEPVKLFDCNGNGRIDFADVVWLFNHL